jgi:aspartate/methionine/tyrosine aminotransferase
VKRFPTHAAEERLRSLGIEPVPLHGTPAPALPPHVVDAVATALGRPAAAPPPRGQAALREALAAELARTTGRATDPEREILVTHGAMQALGVVFRSLLEPGDEVVVQTPCFFFEAPIRAAGGSPTFVFARKGGWTWDADAIERALGPRTRALVLCNPENPTGHLLSREEIAAVVNVADRHGLLVVTDEAYEAAIWGDGVLSSAYPASERALVVRSLGKSLAMPHLRLGLVAGSADLVERCAVSFEWDCLRVGVASQAAALAALTGPREWLAQVRERLARDRAVALELVARTPGLEVVAPAGGPFLFLTALDRRPTLADELVRVGLPAVDGAEFRAPGYARLPFGGAHEARDALERALAAWAEAHVE